VAKESDQQVARPRTVLVNAVSAKFGGARTIIEDFLEFAKRNQQLNFVILTGFEPPSSLPDHIHWQKKPLSGPFAAIFNFLGVFLYFIKYRCSVLLSFNNMNTLLVSACKRITYLHQQKVLEMSFKEPKTRIIRWYLRTAREPIIVQSPQVKDDFIAMFGNRHPVNVIWPGISIPDQHTELVRKPQSLLIPVVSPGTPHKNFDFVQQTAHLLGSGWEVLVTSSDHEVNTAGISNIQFIGVQTRAELFKRYREATCVLMASTHETVGLPIFEALATNTPVVAYDAPYIRSFREKFGIASGLEIADTPRRASQFISQISAEPPRVESSRDFRLGEWDKLLEHL